MGRRAESRRLGPAEVIFILVALLLLLLALFPVLRDTRRHRLRTTCWSNLGGIGKSMLVYANEYQGEFPRAGGPQSLWAARVPDWTAPTQKEAFGENLDGPGQASVSSSLFLLVKYAEVVPAMFVCKGDKGTTRFRPEEYEVSDERLTDLWDFGPVPPKHVSYSYHLPYSHYSLRNSSDPGLAVAGDRNPWIDAPYAKARDFSSFTPDMGAYVGGRELALHGNTLAHEGQAQNVLFLDSHVEFAIRAYCAIDWDNIYTSWDGADKVRGLPGTFGSVAADATDSLLVNDPAAAK